MYSFSIIISTFNRPTLLKEAVKSLVNQKYPLNKLELIIVDNRPPKNFRLIQKIQKEYPKFHIISISEPKQGISFAMNTALSYCSHEKIILFDDDEFADSNLCMNYNKLWSKYSNRRIGMIGGQILPWIEKDFVRDQYNFMNRRFPDLFWVFGTLYWGSKEKNLKYPESLFSGNLSFDKKNIINQGGFDINLGVHRNGKYYYGHDIELCWRLSKKGQEIIYSPDLIVSNYVSDDRLRFGSICRRMLLSGEEMSYIRHKLFNKTPVITELKSLISLFDIRNKIKEIIFQSLFLFSYLKHGFSALIRR